MEKKDREKNRQVEEIKQGNRMEKRKRGMNRGKKINEDKHGIRNREETRRRVKEGPNKKEKEEKRG